MSALPHPKTGFDPERLSSAALQAFFNLSARWGLTAAQERILLGNPPESTVFKWKAEKTARRLGRDVLDRIVPSEFPPINHGGSRPCLLTG